MNDYMQIQGKRGWLHIEDVNLPVYLDAQQVDRLIAFLKREAVAR